MQTIAVPFHDIARQTKTLNASARAYVRILRPHITNTMRLNNVVENMLRETHKATFFPSSLEDKEQAQLESIWVNSDLVDHPTDDNRAVVLNWASRDRKFAPAVSGSHFMGHDQGADYYVRPLTEKPQELSVFMVNEAGVYGEIVAQNLDESHPWYWILVRARSMQIIP